MPVRRPACSYLPMCATAPIALYAVGSATSSAADHHCLRAGCLHQRVSSAAISAALSSRTNAVPTKVLWLSETPVGVRRYTTRVFGVVTTVAPLFRCRHTGGRPPGQWARVGRRQHAHAPQVVVRGESPVVPCGLLPRGRGLRRNTRKRKGCFYGGPSTRTAG